MFPVSYDMMIDEDEENQSSWLASNENLEELVIAEDLERNFVKLLNSNQKEIFFSIMLGGERICDYAKRKGIKEPSVIGTMKKIRKKLKNFYLGG